MNDGNLVANSENGCALYDHIIIESLQKLDYGYILIRCKICKEDEILRWPVYEETIVILNGNVLYKFESLKCVEKIIRFEGGKDYLIGKNARNRSCLMSIIDRKVLIETENQIKYINDGLFGVYSDDSYGTEKVFDLLTNEYVPFPKNTIMATYESGRFLLYEKGKEPYVDKREIVIDRSGKEIVSVECGRISICSADLFITGNNIMKVNETGECKFCINDFIYAFSITQDKTLILNNGKIFILNAKLEYIKVFEFKELKRPIATFNKDGEYIYMTFERDQSKIGNEKGYMTCIIDVEKLTLTQLDFRLEKMEGTIFVIGDGKSKKGLMNEDGEVILEVSYRSIKALHDTGNKYFFLTKEGEGTEEDEYFIFDSQTKTIIKSDCDDMEEFIYGLSLGRNYDGKKVQFMSEDLDIVFELDRVGSNEFYYSNGNLCYYSGNFSHYYDAYTIINNSGEKLMEETECSVTMNDFGLLEIRTKKDGMVRLFDLKLGKFIENIIPISERTYSLIEVLTHGINDLVGNTDRPPQKLLSKNNSWP